jgi:hypothetical protein
VRRLVSAVCVLASLFVLPHAAAEPVAMRYGIADDWPKWHACGDVWWQAAKDVGYQDLRLTVQWDDQQPTVIPYEDEVRAAVDCALLDDVQPILALYPLRPRAIGSDPTAQQRFASFVALVGTAFPQVTDFVIGNEPNVNRFWQPQYVGGRDAAGRDYEHTLAASYDALKTVRPDATVIGPAISSRGNDDPAAATNPSHSPVWFITYMGSAYRASGRTSPIFDEFDLHPYPPVQDTAPFSKTFLWPQAGAADLGRIKQALWDAFHDTGQPLPAEYGGGRTSTAGLPIDLDEAGEQTTVDGHVTAYVDLGENVQPVDPAVQAARYVQLARIGACDPDVKRVVWFPLVDDADVGNGFQSGSIYADLARKPAYAALKAEIATWQGRCPGAMRKWVHTSTVSGAAVVPPSTRNARLAVTASEDATYTATLVRAAPGGRHATGARATGVTVRGRLQAYRKPPVVFPRGIPGGRYRVSLVVASATNPERRRTLLSRPFTVRVK